MASEYDIYRAYAGLNTPQSKLDYFLDGVQRLQKVANENRRLDLQERRLEKEDERAQDRLDLQNAQEDRLQQQFDYNKNKDIEDRKYNKQMQAWNSITSFASQLPEGQRYKFMESQANSIMDSDFMDSQNLWDRMEAFKEAEEDGIVQGDMYYNLKNEDSADKIEQALEMGVIKDNRKKQHLQNKINNIRKAEKKWKPFDISILNPKEQREYKNIESTYNELQKSAIEAKLGRKPDEPISALEQQSLDKAKDAKELLNIYEKRAATAPLPEFTASTESLQMIADDDDLMTAFFADQSNNLDEFIKGRNVGAEEVPDADPNIVPEEIKDKPKDAGSTTSDFIEKYKGNPFPKMTPRDEIKRQAAKTNLTREMNTIKKDIGNLERQISAAERVMKAPIKAGSVKSNTAQRHRKNLEVKLAQLNKDLINAQNQFNDIDTATDFASAE